MADCISLHNTAHTWPEFSHAASLQVPTGLVPLLPLTTWNEKHYSAICIHGLLQGPFQMRGSPSLH